MKNSLLEKPIRAIVNENITHQNIGGKEIIIERKMELQDAPMTIALTNFIKRKPEFIFKEDTIVYYGHVGLYGYYVTEDEITFIEGGE